jgi:hypothetical protein
MICCHDFQFVFVIFNRAEFYSYQNIFVYKCIVCIIVCQHHSNVGYSAKIASPKPAFLKPGRDILN